MDRSSTPLTEIEREILTEVRDREAAVEALPEPPAWQHWEVQEWNDLKACGPRYEPREWFGGGQPLPEKIRVRYLRAIYALMGAGLVEATMGDGRRLQWIKLTPEGQKALGAASRKKK